jgi:hypothetical protein
MTAGPAGDSARPENTVGAMAAMAAAACPGASRRPNWPGRRLAGHSETLMGFLDGRLLNPTSWGESSYLAPLI